MDYCDVQVPRGVVVVPLAALVVQRLASQTAMLVSRRYLDCYRVAGPLPDVVDRFDVPETA